MVYLRNPAVVCRVHNLSVGASHRLWGPLSRVPEAIEYLITSDSASEQQREDNLKQIKDFCLKANAFGCLMCAKFVQQWIARRSLLREIVFRRSTRIKLQ